MDNQRNTSLGQRLLEQNGCCDPGSPLMKSLLSEEKQKLRLIRNICIGVWVAFMSVLMVMAFWMLVRSLDITGTDPALPAILPLRSMVLLTTFALFGLLAAVAVTLVFYFRSRSVNLSGIEQRLAKLEQMLVSEKERQDQG